MSSKFTTRSQLPHWKDSAQALPPDDSSVDVHPLCSSMYFKTKKIHGNDLNINRCSPNKLIWAIHTSTLLKGYQIMATAAT